MFVKKPTSSDESGAPGGEQMKSLQGTQEVLLDRIPTGVRRDSYQLTERKASQFEEGDGLVIVGKGASIVGEITNCTQVEIAGALEGKVVAKAVIVRANGLLKGEVSSQRAEVHGTIEGQVHVEQNLDVRSTGQVSGELAYGELSVASGGRLAGEIHRIARSEEQTSNGRTKALAIVSETANGPIAAKQSEPKKAKNAAREADAESK